MISLLKRNKPLIPVNTGVTDIVALLDTGATFSVYTGEETELKSIFPDAIDSDYKCFISGFGGESLRKVYTIPEFSIGEFTIINIPIAIYPNESISQEIILSSVIFDKIPFTIDYANRILELDTNVNEVRCCLKRSNVIGVIDSFVCFTNE